MASLRDSLRRWLRSSRSGVRPTPSDLPVTRFIFNQNQRRKEGGFRLKPVAFLPRASPNGRLQLSVFRIDGLEHSQIWDLARTYVLPTGRNLHGRADLLRTEIESTEPALQLVMDEAPPRHGNVIRWPADKDEQLALAQELAECATHVEPPDASGP